MKPSGVRGAEARSHAKPRGVPGQGEEVFALGAWLAKQRQLRGIRLEELAALTRLPVRSLERLEAGVYDGQQDGFVRGFVRTVAVAIGLDPEDAVARLLDEQDARLATRLPDLRRVAVAAVGLAGALALTLALWEFARARQLAPTAMVPTAQMLPAPRRKSDALAPLIATFVICSGALPLLVMVVLSPDDITPTVVIGKATVLFCTEQIGEAVSTLVPDSASVVGYNGHLLFDLTKGKIRPFFLAGGASGSRGSCRAGHCHGRRAAARVVRDRDDGRLAARALRLERDLELAAAADGDRADRAGVAGSSGAMPSSGSGVTSRLLPALARSLSSG